MAKGYIKLHRQIQDSDIWNRSEPYDMRSAWIDLLMMANHEDKTIVFDYQPVVIERGQHLTSVRKLSERWKWGKEKTLRYLRLLEQLGMIHRDSNKRRTLITIENYGKYQDAQDSDRPTDQASDRTLPDPLPEHSSTTNKNEKNDKNDKKYISAFDEFWKNYPRKKDKGQAYKCYMARLNDGYSEEELLTACKNYADEVKRNKTEERYIKHGATFLSVNEPFVDYLKGDKHGYSESGTRADVESDEDLQRRYEQVMRQLEEDGEDEWA